MENKICEVCKKPFIPNYGNANRFCSRACSGEFRKQNRKKPVCGHDARMYREQLCRYCYGEKHADELYNDYLCKKYNITLAEYNQLLLKQNYVCALCHKPEKNRKLLVDHDHNTKRVRGLLYTTCNTSIAILVDNHSGLNELIMYLSKGEQP